LASFLFFLQKEEIEEDGDGDPENKSPKPPPPFAEMMDNRRYINKAVDMLN
jgi:hypothetical protein